MTRAETRNRCRACAIGSILLAMSVAGCSAMQGINVGASIPIGPVSVGASKTIERSPAPAPTPAPAPAPSDKKKPSDQSSDQPSDPSGDSAAPQG